MNLRTSVEDRNRADSSKSESNQPKNRPAFYDRLAVIAAGGCAIHCAVTPLILALAPAIGGAWVSPEVHWALAMISLPLAGWLLFRNNHLPRSRWISGFAIAGMAGIVVGLVSPELPPLWASSGDENAAVPASSCAETCCPTVSVGPDGAVSARIPFASAATMVGGLFLSTAHVGNLRRRRKYHGCASDTCCD